MEDNALTSPQVTQLLVGGAKEGLVWHDLRANYGTRLGEAGFDAYDIAKLMGHANISTSRRYVRNLPLGGGTSEPLGEHSVSSQDGVRESIKSGPAVVLNFDDVIINIICATFAHSRVGICRIAPAIECADTVTIVCIAIQAGIR